MAYLDQKRIARSPATLIVVATLEAAAIYAVVTGLIVDIVPRAKDGPLVAHEFPLPEPSPPPKDIAKPHEPLPVDRKPPHIAPAADTGLFKQDPFVFEPGPIAPPSPDPVSDFVPKPSPSPAPGFTPRFARPLGNTSAWATSADYPGSDLRQGNQGQVRFSLTVGANGRVSACVVTRSSGFPGLDQATCENVAHRARFEPATDASGAKVTGTYAGSVRWVIPE